MGYTMQSNIIPRSMVVGFSGLILFSIVIATASRMSGNYVMTMPSSPVVASRELRFEDRVDRGVDIRDATTGSLVETVAPKTGGFLRGAMRGLLYQLRNGPNHGDKSPDYAFRLVRYADGRLCLEDTQTHQRLELEAFGSTNAAVFSKLLDENKS